MDVWSVEKLLIYSCCLYQQRGDVVGAVVNRAIGGGLCPKNFITQNPPIAQSAIVGLGGATIGCAPLSDIVGPGTRLDRPTDYPFVEAARWSRVLHSTVSAMVTATATNISGGKGWKTIDCGTLPGIRSPSSRELRTATTKIHRSHSILP